MRHRRSRRQWKRRCQFGRRIPATAIVDYQLDRWYTFYLHGYGMDRFYIATRK